MHCRSHRFNGGSALIIESQVKNARREVNENEGKMKYLRGRITELSKEIKSKQTQYKNMHDESKKNEKIDLLKEIEILQHENRANNRSMHSIFNSLQESILVCNRLQTKYKEELLRSQAEELKSKDENQISEYHTTDSNSKLYFLNMIKMQYENQNKDIETTLKDLREKMNAETLTKQEFEEIELLFEILQLQLNRHREFNIIKQQLEVKDDIIASLSAKKWQDYNISFNQFLLYNINTNQKLILLETQNKQILGTINEYNDLTLDIIQSAVAKIKKEDTDWASKLKHLTQNIGANVLTDGAKQLLAQTVELLDKL